MTKLYFHNATSTVSGALPSTSQSSLGTPAQLVDATSVNRIMDTNIGVSQTSKVASEPSTTISVTENTYFTRFCTPPLNIASLAADTWNYVFAGAKSNTATSFPTGHCTVYVWRPSNGTKIATIFDGTASGVSAITSTSTEKSCSGTFSGSAVSFATGDIICYEAYIPVSLGSHEATSTVTYYYDGTTETNNNGTTVSSQASHIESPNNTITFQVSQHYIIGISEANGSISDAVKKKGFSKQIEPALTPSETIKKFMKAKTISEPSLSVSDSAVSFRVFPRPISDSDGSITDAVKKKATKHIAEISLTDTEAIKKKAIKPISESISVSESITKIHRFIRTLTDPIPSISESIRKKLVTRVLESISISEAIPKKASKSIADNAGSISDVAKRIPHPFISNPAIAISEAVKKKAAHAISESLSISESVKKNAIKHIAQALGSITESVKKSSRKIISETLLVSETVKKKAIKAISEALSVSESIQSSHRFIRTISEGLGSISESLHKKAIKFISQNIAISEILASAFSKAGFFVRNIIESIGYSDTITIRDIKPISQSLSASEAITKKSKDAINESSLSVSDSLNRIDIKNLETSQSLSISENIQKISSLSISENLGLIHIESLVKVAIKSIIEPILSISESVTRSLHVMRMIIQSISVSESVKKRANKHISEPGVNITELTRRVSGGIFSISETIPYSDSLRGGKLLVIRISEFILGASVGMGVFGRIREIGGSRKLSIHRN